MNLIVRDAIRYAGEISRACALNLQANDYTIRPDGIAPDTRHAMSILSAALVQDRTGHDTLGDFYRAGDPSANKDEIRTRAWYRLSLTDALTALSREDRIALIDALAAGRNVIAA